MNIVYNLLQQIKNPEKNKPSSEVDIKKASQARLVFVPYDLVLVNKIKTVKEHR